MRRFVLFGFAWVSAYSFRECLWAINTEETHASHRRMENTVHTVCVSTGGGVAFQLYIYFPRTRKLSQSRTTLRCFRKDLDKSLPKIYCLTLAPPLPLLSRKTGAEKQSLPRPSSTLSFQFFFLQNGEGCPETEQHQGVFGKIWARAFRKYFFDLNILTVVEETSDEKRSRLTLCANSTLFFYGISGAKLVMLKASSDACGNVLDKRKDRTSLPGGRAIDFRITTHPISYQTDSIRTQAMSPSILNVYRCFKANLTPADHSEKSPPGICRDVGVLGRKTCGFFHERSRSACISKIKRLPLLFKAHSRRP